MLRFTEMPGDSNAELPAAAVPQAIAFQSQSDPSVSAITGPADNKGETELTESFRTERGGGCKLRSHATNLALRFAQDARALEGP